MEEWKDIKGYEWLYQVSNKWRIKRISYVRVTTDKILKQWKFRGYSVIKLSIKWKVKNFRVHRLVAQAFLWLNIRDTKKCVLHKLEILNNWFLDNSIDNLFLWSHKDNMQDMVKKWRNNFKSRIQKRKKVNQYTKSWKFIKTWDSMCEVTKNTQIRNWHISEVCNWKRKTAWWFLWKFY